MSMIEFHRGESQLSRKVLNDPRFRNAAYRDDLPLGLDDQELDYLQRYPGLDLIQFGQGGMFLPLYKRLCYFSFQTIDKAIHEGTPLVPKTLLTFDDEIKLYRLNDDNLIVVLPEAVHCFAIDGSHIIAVWVVKSQLDQPNTMQLTNDFVLVGQFNKGCQVLQLVQGKKVYQLMSQKFDTAAILNGGLFLGLTIQTLTVVQLCSDDKNVNVHARKIDQTTRFHAIFGLKNKTILLAGCCYDQDEREKTRFSQSGAVFVWLQGNLWDSIEFKEEVRPSLMNKDIPYFLNLKPNSIGFHLLKVPWLKQKYLLPLTKCTRNIELLTGRELTGAGLDHGGFPVLGAGLLTNKLPSECRSGLVQVDRVGGNLLVFKNKIDGEDQVCLFPHSLFLISDQGMLHRVLVLKREPHWPLDSCPTQLSNLRPQLKSFEITLYQKKINDPNKQVPVFLQLPQDSKVNQSCNESWFKEDQNQQPIIRPALSQCSQTNSKAPKKEQQTQAHNLAVKKEMIYKKQQIQTNNKALKKETIYKKQQTQTNYRAIIKEQQPFTNNKVLIKEQQPFTNNKVLLKEQQTINIALKKKLQNNKVQTKEQDKQIYYSVQQQFDPIPVIQKIKALPKSKRKQWAQIQICDFYFNSKMKNVANQSKQQSKAIQQHINSNLNNLELALNIIKSSKVEQKQQSQNKKQIKVKELQGCQKSKQSSAQPPKIGKQAHSTSAFNNSFKPINSFLSNFENKQRNLNSQAQNNLDQETKQIKNILSAQPPVKKQIAGIPFKLNFLNQDKNKLSSPLINGALCDEAEKNRKKAQEDLKIKRIKQMATNLDMLSRRLRGQCPFDYTRLEVNLKNIEYLQRRIKQFKCQGQQSKLFQVEQIQQGIKAAKRQLLDKGKKETLNQLYERANFTATSCAKLIHYVDCYKSVGQKLTWSQVTSAYLQRLQELRKSLSVMQLSKDDYQRKKGQFRFLAENTVSKGLKSKIGANLGELKGNIIKNLQPNYTFETKAKTMRGLDRSELEVALFAERKFVRSGLVQKRDPHSKRESASVFL